MQQLDCIILVDDDEVTNFVHEAVIEDAGVTKEVLVVEDGRKALNLLQELENNSTNCPNLIFLDINMPVMNGFEFLDAYQQMKGQLKQPVIIVMLTSSLNPQDVVRAQAAGATDFLDKPLTADKLNDVLGKYFDGK
jgi:CheY-like chemotaxis protein